MVGGLYNSITESPVQVVVPIAGTFKNFCMRTTAAQGGSSSTLTLRINGVNTSVVITVTASAGAGTFCDNSNSVAFAAKDLMSIIIGGATTPATTGMVIEFDAN